MGVDLNAVIGHRLDAAQALDLPARLARSAAVAAAAAEVYAALKPRWPNLEPVVWAWRAGIESAAVIQAAWDRHETPDLENAAGFTLYVGRRAISAWHLEKIAGFVDDTAGFQTPLRRLCRAIAREVGGDRAIYMPDSAYPLSAVGYNAIHDGAAFDEIVRQLQQDFKPPAPTIRAIMTEHDNGDWDVDGYFIDDFADLINDVSATVRR